MSIAISVIVPIYKVEKYLVQCIESILNQTLRNIEVILVDEGDMDACRFICDHYEALDKRVRTIHEKNGGYGASVNKGFKIAQGEYISIIESDDFIESTMYEEMYNYAKRLDADVVKSPFYEYFDKTKTSQEKKVVTWYRDWLNKVYPVDRLYSMLDKPQLMAVHASLWSGIYKTSYLKRKQIKFVEVKGGAYVDVGFRIDTLINSDKIGWYPKPFYNWRLTSEGSTTNNFNLAEMVERWREVHTTIDKKIYDKISRYLYVDEYLNTLSYVLNLNYIVSDEVKKIIYDNLQYVSEDAIQLCDISKKEKKFVLKIKRCKDEKAALRKMNLQRNLTSHFSFSKTHFSLHLFLGLKHNIFRTMFRLGGLFVIDICVGKLK